MEEVEYYFAYELLKERKFAHEETQKKCGFGK